MIDGLVVAARIAAASGAVQIGSSFASMGLRDLPSVRKTGTKKEIEMDELKREQAIDLFCNDLIAHGVTTDFNTLLFSAHQMGTCRMGSDRTQSVVNENGETWSCQNLFVCDASVFPTSSGVNPMLTTLAIADGIADIVLGRCREMKSRTVTSGRRVSRL